MRESEATQKMRMNVNGKVIEIKIYERKMFVCEHTHRECKKRTRGMNKSVLGVVVALKWDLSGLLIFIHTCVLSQ